MTEGQITRSSWMSRYSTTGEDASQVSAVLRFLETGALLRGELAANPSAHDARSNNAIDGEVERLLAGGQGFITDAARRRAVENRAMSLAMEYWGEGWHVEDKHKDESFDLLCSKDSDQFIVEVKGTTCAGDSVIITEAELKAHRAWAPRNALYVISEITVDGPADAPTARGGKLRALLRPWKVPSTSVAIGDDASGSLEPLIWKYRLP